MLSLLSVVCAGFALWASSRILDIAHERLREARRLHEESERLLAEVRALYDEDEGGDDDDDPDPDDGEPIPEEPPADVLPIRRAA